MNLYKAQCYGYVKPTLAPIKAPTLKHVFVVAKDFDEACEKMKIEMEYGENWAKNSRMNWIQPYVEDDQEFGPMLLWR